MVLRKLLSMALKVYVTVAMPIIICGVLWIVYWLTFRLETYCWWYPEIDTVFAQGFKKENFPLVRPGMTRAEVVSLIGDTKWKWVEDGREELSYSRDGAMVIGDWMWGDKAWIGYKVVLTNGVVVSSERRVYYD